MRETLEENVRLKDENKKEEKIENLREVFKEQMKVKESNNKSDKEKGNKTLVNKPSKSYISVVSGSNSKDITRKADENVNKPTNSAESSTKKVDDNVNKKDKPAEEVNLTEEHNCSKWSYQGCSIDEVKKHSTMKHGEGPNQECEECQFKCNGFEEMRKHKYECHQMQPVRFLRSE